MKRKKGKYRIGPQRDWDDWTSKTLGVDGTPPWWTVTERMVNIMSDERMVRGMPLKERSI